jgi:primosomal protein N' (replication factor Y)
MSLFQTLFVQIILPLPVKGTFTYRVPQELIDDLEIGKRAVVPFGKSKIYSGIISEIHDRMPDKYEVKYIFDIIDDKPVVTKYQLKFWNWISEYYMCHLGDVMQAAMPSGLKLSSETMISMHPEFDGDIGQLNPKELLITEACANAESLSLSQISKLIDVRKAMPIIKNLLLKNIIQINEQLEDSYKPKIIKEVVLSDEYACNELRLSALLDELGQSKKTYKQMMTMMHYLKLTNANPHQKVSVDKFEGEHVSKSSLKTLIDKGIIEVHERVVSRLVKIGDVSRQNDIQYTEYQASAIAKMEDELSEKNTVLLHGITGSGKTEIYIHFIHKALSEGKQVLFLLPEIALTSQIVNRLRIYFGKKVGVYHSKFNEFERVDIWNAVLKNSDIGLDRFSVILGARSSIFLPFSNLGLVIVDEEHDASYKQFDPSPRYQARDAALYLAGMHGAKTILGSATPSMESYHMAMQSKFGHCELKERFGKAVLPKIVIVDMKEQQKLKLLKSHYSSILLEHIENALKKDEQAILFQNRRGFSARIECDDCHYVIPCKSCDVSMTYHKNSNVLKCHYCGYKLEVPRHCPVCNSLKLSTKGFGTEKIEEDLQIFFPDAKISRMDYDSTRSKNAYQQIIQDFEQKKINILVGTQMVTKGLDFDSVSVVGILNADNLINFPDFRSYERSFQMMAQVSGRAGRKEIPGTVIIQTYNPQHSVMKLVLENNYEEMYRTQILEREQFSYPPFVRTLKISIKHLDFKVLNNAADVLVKMIYNGTKLNVIGPEFPLIGRIKNYYIKDILLKLPKNKSQQLYKQKINEIIEQFETIAEYKACRISKDVDSF